MDEVNCGRRGAVWAGSATARAGGAGRLVWLALAAGCGTVADGAAVAAGPGPAGMGAAEVAGADSAAARFLDAVARGDHAEMARHFGTGAGALGAEGGGVGCALRRAGSWVGIGERCATVAEIEMRMALLARILAHDSYRIGGSAGVAGRRTTARRIEVELAREAGRAAMVPFVVVKAGGGWLVEEVELAAALERPHSRSP